MPAESPNQQRLVVMPAVDRSHDDSRSSRGRKDVGDTGKERQDTNRI